MTTDDLHALCDDGWADELVDGVLVRSDTAVAPDVAFVSADRAPSPASPDYDSQAWPLAPDLAVEVASENQYAPVSR